MPPTFPRYYTMKVGHLYPPNLPNFLDFSIYLL